MNGHVLASVRTVFYGGLRADRQFAFDFRVFINQELHGIHVLVFLHFNGEFRISNRQDSPRQRLVIGYGLRTAALRLGGERRGPDCHCETSKKQGCQTK